VAVDADGLDIRNSNMTMAFSADQFVHMVVRGLIFTRFPASGAYLCTAINFSAAKTVADANNSLASLAMLGS
jgi:hypothetical protein